MPFTPFARTAPIVDPGDAVEWRARWIQNPLFFHRTYREKRPCGRGVTEGSDLVNIHSFYRRAVTLRSKPKRAILRVTADDTCRLYFNGALAVLGPAQAMPCRYFYNIYDVTDALDAGELVIAAHVYYFGLRGHSYVSGDDLEGLFLQLDVEYPDGSVLRVATDSGWRVLTCYAWRTQMPYGYSTQFVEDIDLAAIPAGWREPGFDDGGWQRAMVRGVPYPPPYRLVPQPTPPLELTARAPVDVRETAPGRWLLDFGTEIVGCTQLLARGAAQQVVEIRHGEELEADGGVRYRLRANCLYLDFAKLTGGDDRIELFDYKGFRYVELRGFPSVPDAQNVRVLAMSYPFPERGAMRCADRRMERIWNICANAVRWGTQDTYFDCPTREKGGFLGDAYVTAFSHLYLTGDARLLRKLLDDFAVGLRYDAGMTDVTPSYVTGGLADYTLLYPSLLERYYRQTGDAETVRALLYAVDALAEVARGWENEDGLISAPSSPIAPDEELTLVDWPPEMRVGFDFDGAKNTACSVLNENYYCFCESAARLYELCGERALSEACRVKALSIARAMGARMYDSARRLYTDHVGTHSCTLHGNVPALAFGMPFPGGHADAVALVKQRGLQCGVWFAYFVLRGLYNAGEYETAWSLLDGNGLFSWNSMLECGATSCFEVWEPSMKANASLCHPWASSPIVFWVEEVCGLTPAAPRWTRVRFAPRMPRSLAGGSVSVPTPRGDVAVVFTRNGDDAAYTLTLPEALPVEFSLPAGASDVLLDAEPLAVTPAVERLGVPALTAECVLAAGRHTLTARGL